MGQQGSLIGTTLSQYQILDELGRGGMSVVYKAWQPSLRRYVALKILQPHLTNDWEFVQRFQQEAIVAANLRHPNIVTIYEVGQQERYLFIAMEFVEGRSLEAIIKQEGALPLPRAVALLRQVATALDYAHERRFVHRDIKPANIMVTPDERVIITDFGIAKAMEGSGATARITQAGSVLGTLEYMAPEQIQGQPPDYRADLYSLGIVTYEMLTGRIPFDSPTTASLLYAQVNLLPPDVRQLAPALPPYVAQALARMLAKNPSDRFPSAGAFVEALNGAAPAVAEPKAKTAVMPSPMQVPTYGTLPAGTSPINNYDTYPLQMPQPEYPTPTTLGITPEISAPKKKPLWPWLLGVGLMLCLLAVAAVVIGISVFKTGKSARETPISLQTEIAVNNQIAFVSERNGNPQIFIINSDGTQLHPLTTGRSSDYYPRWSPDAQQISSHSYPPGIQAGQGDAQLYLIDVATGSRKLLQTTVMNAKFADWSPDGKTIVFSGEQEGNWDLYIFVLENGSLRHLTQGSGNDYFAAWSPNGQKVAFVRDEGDEREILVVSADGLEVTNITNHPGWDSHPDWSPDGQQIVFASRRSDNIEIFVMASDGSYVQQLTNTPGYNNTEPRWSPDGQRIVFVSNRDGNQEIYVMNANGTNPIRLTNNEKPDYNPHWR